MKIEKEPVFFYHIYDFHEKSKNEKSKNRPSGKYGGFYFVLILEIRDVFV
jgi:hypothetical protein